MNEQDKELFLKNLVGQSETDAVQLLTHHGWEVRVELRDGEALMGTFDFREDRVKLHIQDGKITEACIG